MKVNLYHTVYNGLDFFASRKSKIFQFNGVHAAGLLGPKHFSVNKSIFLRSWSVVSVRVTHPSIFAAHFTPRNTGIWDVDDITREELNELNTIQCILISLG